MKELILENLHCADCAIKIEDRTKKIGKVKNCNVNFVSKKMMIDTTLDEKFLINTIQNIADSIKPGVKVLVMNSEEDGHNHSHDLEDEKSLIIRLVVGSILFALPLIFQFVNILEFSLFVVAYAIVGYDVILTAINNLFKGQIFNEHFLMTAATLGAFIIGEYSEGVGVMLFYLVGELFQAKAVNRSRKSIKKLLDIKADYANLVVENGEKKIAPEELKIGDIILVKAGEKIPVDGIVIEGESMLDTKALTGESVPRKTNKGDEVFSGSINVNSLLRIKVEKEFEDSAVSKIINLVENAGNKKAETEQFITKFSKYYTPVVVVFAVLLATIPPLFVGNFNDWLYRALVFLVVSCPCALVISIPVAFIGGIGGASKKGVLVKGGNYLEALNNIDTIVFDKTGTLTKGVFNVTQINSISDLSKSELLKIAAIFERHSNHPIADSIVTAYLEEKLTNDLFNYKINNYEEISGHGIRGVLNEKEYLLGNAKLLNKYNIKFEGNTDAETVVYIASDGKYLGNILIADEIKEDSIEAIKILKAKGINNTVMLTGDSNKTAQRIGKQLGIDKIYSELLPQDKVEKVENLLDTKPEKSKLVFVGDGINDAPVLTRADIGIAMGGLGSDAAIEASDIVLMTDEISKIAEAIDVARKTRKIALQNIAFALVVKIIFLILGAMGFATMWEAVFADVGVTILAILNSMRTLK